MIPLNYAEPIARTDPPNAPAVSDFADRVVAAAGLVAAIALTSLAIPLGRRLPHSLRRNMRRWFVRRF